MLTLIGYVLAAIAGLKLFGYSVPMTSLTVLSILSLGGAKFFRAPGAASGPAFQIPKIPQNAERILNHALPTIMALVRQADAALTAHEHFEAEVGGTSAPAFQNWLMSGLRAAAYWVPMCLLAMVAGAVLVSPLKLVSGGLGLADTDTGQWLLKQWWPRLAARVASIEVLGQIFLLGFFDVWRALFRRLRYKRSDPELAAALVLSSGFLAFLLEQGDPWMRAVPLLGIQLALVYAYARTRTMLVPAAAGVVMGLASLYSARMVVLLTAHLGSLESLPGIPGVFGVLAVLALSLSLFALLAAWRFGASHGMNFLTAAARDQWERLRSAGLWWSRASSLPKSPLALLPVALPWGVAIYLASYLSYYAVYAIAPVQESVPPMLKQTLLMPFDMLVYIFLIGAALEEVIFRKGLFKALKPAVGVRRAAAISAVVFSAFHFIDFSVVLSFLGVNASRLIKSMMMVYGFSWAGFTGRVAAGLLLAALYEQAGVLLIPILAHFTSNLIEAVGLRWGLGWFLAAVAAIFALQVLDRRA